jgi:hypothetical protein
MLTLLLLLLSLANIGQGTGKPEIGVIWDADGNANVRSEPKTDSKVIGRLRQNELLYFIRSGNLWWKVTATRWGEDVSVSPPPPPERNGYIHSSRIVPITNLSISEIETFYGPEWKKEKMETRFGSIKITLFNADRIGNADLYTVPESNSAYLEIKIQDHKPVRKYYPDINGLGGAADVRFVPVSSMPDFRFFVKNGDYDGRTIIVSKDGRVADIEGGGFILFDHFLISERGTDCCGEPIVWDLNSWKKVYDLLDDSCIEIASEPQFSYFIVSGKLYLKIEMPFGGDQPPQFFQLNKDGRFIQELNPHRVDEEIKMLPEDLH